MWGVYMSKFCMNCGQELDDNASFCFNCGRILIIMKLKKKM